MAHDLVTELLQYSSLACFMSIWQLCANLLIPNCLRSNLSYSPLAALELYVNVYNSQKSDVMSELALANVEALADDESVTVECPGGTDECARVLVGNTVHLFYKK